MPDPHSALRPMAEGVAGARIRVHGTPEGAAPGRHPRDTAGTSAAGLGSWRPPRPRTLVPAPKAAYVETPTYAAKDPDRAPQYPNGILGPSWAGRQARPYWVTKSSKASLTPSRDKAVRRPPLSHLWPSVLLRAPRIITSHPWFRTMGNHAEFSSENKSGSGPRKTHGAKSW